MTPSELYDLRVRYNLTQASLAELMQMSANTSARWERGKVPINQGLAYLAFEVLRLRAALRRTQERLYDAAYNC